MMNPAGTDWWAVAESGACSIDDYVASAAALSSQSARLPIARRPISPQPKLLDQVRAALRIRHYSIRTEEAYLGWIRRFVRFHDLRHPRVLGKDEITAFLNQLAVDSMVSASTQNQALSALLFLYRHVLDDDFPWLNECFAPAET